MKIHIKAILAITIMLISCAVPVNGQIISGHPLNVDSVKRDFTDQPYFGLYKDNYFIVGPDIGHKITRTNTNVKFQISIAQRLTKATLPFGTYFYLFYSQKCFWNVFENSMPMRDLNFNPGIGLTKPLFVKNRFIGKVSLIVEHESNGRDSIYSRSWNKISLAGNILVDDNLMVHAKIWIPIVDGVNNKDIVKYCGIFQSGVQVWSNNRKFFGDVTIVKRKGINLNYNTILQLAYRFSKQSNQFFFLQYYNGYGEGLLDYNKFRSQLRVGMVIRPTMFSDF